MRPMRLGYDIGEHDVHSLGSVIVTLHTGLGESFHGRTPARGPLLHMWDDYEPDPTDSELMRLIINHVFVKDGTIEFLACSRTAMRILCLRDARLVLERIQTACAEVKSRQTILITRQELAKGETHGDAASLSEPLHSLRRLLDRALRALPC